MSGKFLRGTVVVLLAVSSAIAFEEPASCDLVRVDRHSVLVNGFVVDSEEFLAELDELADSHPEGPLVVAAHPRASFGRFLQVLDVVDFAVTGRPRDVLAGWIVVQYRRLFGFDPYAVLAQGECADAGVTGYSGADPPVRLVATGGKLREPDLPELTYAVHAPVAQCAVLVSWLESRTPWSYAVAVRCPGMEERVDPSSDRFRDLVSAKRVSLRVDRDIPFRVVEGVISSLERAEAQAVLLAGASEKSVLLDRFGQHIPAKPPKPGEPYRYCYCKKTGQSGAQSADSRNTLGPQVIRPRAEPGNDPAQ